MRASSDTLVRALRRRRRGMRTVDRAAAINEAMGDDGARNDAPCERRQRRGASTQHARRRQQAARSLAPDAGCLVGVGAPCPLAPLRLTTDDAGRAARRASDASPRTLVCNGITQRAHHPRCSAAPPKSCSRERRTQNAAGRHNEHAEQQAHVTTTTGRSADGCAAGRHACTSAPASHASAGAANGQTPQPEQAMVPWCPRPRPQLAHRPTATVASASTVARSGYATQHPSLLPCSRSRSTRGVSVPSYRGGSALRVRSCTSASSASARAHPTHHRRGAAHAPRRLLRITAVWVARRTRASVCHAPCRAGRAHGSRERGAGDRARRAAHVQGTQQHGARA
jgi:hypothetical protein